MGAPREFISPPPNGADLSGSKSLAVLLVDDTIDHLTLNKAILESERYKVFTASSGRIALGILSEIAQPDLILLDMQMAEMSGLEFITELENTRPGILKNVPIVFLTGMNEVPESKATGVIKKPVDIENFLVSVRRFIEQGPKHQNSH